jgi:hypothetical protein
MTRLEAAVVELVDALRAELEVHRPDEPESSDSRPRSVPSF